jgi:hypothetical protein
MLDPLEQVIRELVKEWPGIKAPRVTEILRDDCAIEAAVRHTKTGFWPARRFGSLGELDELYAAWRDQVALPRRSHRRRAPGCRARGAAAAAADRLRGRRTSLVARSD